MNVRILSYLFFLPIQKFPENWGELFSGSFLVLVSSMKVLNAITKRHGNLPLK